MSKANDPSVNFTPAHETSAHKALAMVSGVLALISITMLALQVNTVLGPFLWLAFAIACTAGTGVFLLMLSIDNEKKAKAH